MRSLSASTLAVITSIFQVSSSLPRPLEIAIHSDRNGTSKVYEMISRPIIHVSSTLPRPAEPAVRRDGDATAQDYELVTSPGEIPKLRLVVPVEPEPPVNPYMHLEPEQGPKEEPSDEPNEELEAPPANEPANNPKPKPKAETNEPSNTDLVNINDMTSIHCGRVCTIKTRHPWNVQEKTAEQYCQTQIMARLYWELGPFAKCVLAQCSGFLLEQLLQEYTDWRRNFCKGYQNHLSEMFMNVEDKYDLAIATKSIEDAMGNPKVMEIALRKSQSQEWGDGVEDRWGTRPKGK